MIFSVCHAAVNAGYQTFNIQIDRLQRNNRPFAAKPSCNLLFMKLWDITQEMPQMEQACQKYLNGQV